MFFVLIVYSQSKTKELIDIDNLKSKNTFGIIVLLVIIFYMGLRPISFVFGDMGVYAIDFTNYANGMEFREGGDVLFEYFLMISSKFLSVESFFFLCSVLYVLPLYFFSKKIFKDYWFYGFFMLAISFSFWAYGTNGIRNGLATSLFLFAISRDKHILKYFLFFISLSIHHSLLIPVIAYIVAYFYKNTKMYLAVWLLCIPLSFILGSTLENFFIGLGLVDEDRVIAYLSGSDAYLDKLVEVKVGFRWDFILYSATGVYAGWYFIVKKKFHDVFYNHFFSTYLIANSLWILVIRANFSNRIAYLSWFMLGAIIIYPLLKNQIFNRQHVVVGTIILIYFAFTYILNVILT